MIISETPLRASLFGGGSDFKKYFENSDIGYGETLSLTLDMHVYITVNKKFDDQIRVVYKGSELVDSVNDIKHNIIREALKLVGIDKGIEIIYMAFSKRGLLHRDRMYEAKHRYSRSICSSIWWF